MAATQLKTAQTEANTQTSGSRSKASGGKKSGSGSSRKKQVNVFHQRLGSLTYHQACQMLGDEGGKLIRVGSRFTEIESDDDVFLGGDLLRINLADCMAKYGGPDEEPEFVGTVTVTMTLQSARAKQIQTNCNHCDSHCHHVGAALGYLLDSKSVLGLAMPPDESVPLENLTEDELLARAMAERQKRADEEDMRVRSADPSTPWADYVTTSHNTGKTYRVSLRGLEPHQSYCSCPDFRTNGLGTCKHILHVAAKVKKRFGVAALEQPYQRKHVSLRLHYGDDFGLRFNVPTRKNPSVEEIVGDLVDKSTTDAADVMRRIEALETKGRELTIYPDAEDYIQRQLTTAEMAKRCAEIRRDPERHPMRTELLSATLLPYQLDGIAFAATAGRAILADDMGLGKTIQGIGVAELLAKWAGIRRVLIVCPASLKNQWRTEVGRFCGRSVQVVLGNGPERIEQYQSDTFFTVCNYEQVLRDLEPIESVDWDLIILDEGQRIKNWESKTSNMIRSLRSPYRLVLSGTPLENNLGELFTVARFVDENRLGSAFKFFNRHRVVDDRGKTIGYQKLDELRQTIAPILLRRTRGEVSKQLPERIDEIVRVTPTEEQKEIHDGQMQIVAQIVGKKFLTEMDLLRLRRALAMARMSCDSTFLVNQQEPEYSSKLERLHELLDGLIADPHRKIVLFSEWKRMLDRVERRLDMIGCEYVRLDGSVPQKKRPAIVAEFQENPDCRVILMTNAGSTGLNLQSANVVINCDLPWNPAVLEQRIARAHRMGQKNPVHIYNMVSSETIEEQLLNTLASKQELANASLDIDSEISEVAVSSSTDDLRRRLEQMALPKFAAPVDESSQRRTEAELEQIHRHREDISKATGDLVSAALALAGNLLGGNSQGGHSQNGDAETSSEPTPEHIAKVDRLTEKLSKTIETDEQGRPQLKITLPDQNALRSLADTLARLLG
ncbi:DEAD/DEAH box helicase [Neorhodopirellula pilleata]|uniref:RNA polymerase-associated protein RapA n=1 Tax=Neorhodopirellula pilleata TaxID=2714738 RepID=A0A5C6AE50_9BACT|nr:DEAD/DEAH box helicase [Neorhodopirellula pilleata]TWT97351.1 RNA polymerase-associated protein RapA [Neorhodopirellula pilleata]